MQEKYNQRKILELKALSLNIKYGYSVPAGFTNLAADAQQKTLSTGKRVLYASYDRKFYQEAVDICASHGAEIVLPISQQENIEVRDFLRETRDNHGPDVNILGAFVRVANIGQSCKTKLWICKIVKFWLWEITTQHNSFWGTLTNCEIDEKYYFHIWDSANFENFWSI